MRSIVLAAVLVGCAWGNYRVVSRTPEGGELALVGGYNDDTARKKADAFMASACPGGYTVTEESEAAASDGSTSSQAASSDVLGHNRQSSAALANEERREARLKYQCKKVHE